MKIGIITFHSAHNYGAVLQAWSLQEYLKQQGHEVEIVNLRLNVIDKLYRLTYKTNKKICGIEAVNKFANYVYYQVRKESYRFTDAAKYEKYYKFERFINHKLPVTKEVNNLEELQKLNLRYDALIAGSDQIWNAAMMKGINPAYFLQFGNADALRISYAASIGTEEIPPQYRLLFQRYLREFDYISVREKKARDQVMQLTDQPVDLVADPTFLLKREDFDKIRKKPKTSGKYIYVHNVHLQRVDESLNSVAEEMSKRLGLPIIHNWSQKVYSNEAGHFTGGIEEFVGMVSEAEYVITNSFHCTVFAIIYNRNFITVPHFKNPDRMRNLLDDLGILEHLIDSGSKIPKDLSKLVIDYEEVERRRSVMGDHAKAFLKTSLAGEKHEDNRNYFEREDIFRCYGCAACQTVCPADAIRMEEDHEGFRYPVIDQEKCIHCGKCEKVCIYRRSELKNEAQESLPLVYAAYSKQESIVKESTSGGMFTPMYQNILAKHGCVAGVQYDENMEVVYGIAENEKECEAFRHSKYIFPDSRDVKKQVKKLLKEGRYVLFSGSPCQISALKASLGKEYPNLYTVEIICHGAGSPKVFRKYREYLEKLYQSKLVDFQFRNKFKGVDLPFILMEFESGSIDIESALKNNLSRGFRSNNIQRPSCYNCEFVAQKYGVADITIGDYWGIQEEHPDFDNGGKGVSLLKINTPKGKAFFEEWKDHLELCESTYEKAYAHNYKRLMCMMGTRTRLMYYLDEKPIDDLLLTFNRSKKGGIKGL